MRNGYPKTADKPDFTDYTVAGGTEGWFNAALCRAEYEEKRNNIRTTREAKRMCRATVPDGLNHTAQSDIRCGYPTKRVIDDDIPSKRGVPHSKFLKRFKIIDRITFSNALGEFVYSAKIYVLHATRGWKLYA